MAQPNLVNITDQKYKHLVSSKIIVVSCKLFWKSAPELELKLKKLTLCNRAVFLTILSSSPQCIVTQLHDCSFSGPSELGGRGTIPPPPHFGKNGSKTPSKDPAPPPLLPDFRNIRRPCCWSLMMYA